jgi:hypothetical protein
VTAHATHPMAVLSTSASMCRKHMEKVHEVNMDGLCECVEIWNFFSRFFSTFTNVNFYILRCTHYIDNVPVGKASGASPKAAATAAALRSLETLTKRCFTLQVGKIWEFFF